MDSDAIRYAFRPRLSAEHKAQILAMLAETSRILESRGIRYVLVAGGLIGQQLLGDMLPWDSDLDLVLLQPFDAPAELILPTFSVRRLQPSYCKIYDCRHPISDAWWWSEASIDLCDTWFDETTNAWRHNSVYGGTDDYPVELMEPTTIGTLAGVAVRIPAQAEQLLARLYGPDWRNSAVPPGAGRPDQHDPADHPRAPLDEIYRICGYAKPTA